MEIGAIGMGKSSVTRLFTEMSAELQKANPNPSYMGKGYTNEDMVNTLEKIRKPYIVDIEISEIVRTKMLQRPDCYGSDKCNTTFCTKDCTYKHNRIPTLKKN